MGTFSYLHTTRWLAATSLAGMSMLCSAAAVAADAGSETPVSQAPGDPVVDERSTIVVIGHRAIVASLQDAPVEQTYEQEDVASYDASTVGEVLDAVREENGDTDPTLLVNGRPVADSNDVADLPAEAIARIEMLPRGTAQKVNGAVGQRVYNVVLRSSVRSATGTASREAATEGGWHNLRGEALFTSIKGQNRLNLVLRGSRSGSLLESERDFTPAPETVPYSALGNIQPAFGLEVDPALSALAGQPVSVVALPAGSTMPSLSSLLPGANQINPSNRSNYRTLRGPLKTKEIGLSGNRVLTENLALSFNARLSWQENGSLYGLPSARFLIPSSNPYSPFDVPVYIALNDPSRPLRSNSDSNGQELSATLNGAFGRWRGSLSGRYSRSAQTFDFEYSGSLTGSSAMVDDATNPFAGTLATRIPVVSRHNYSRTETTRFDAEAQGPLLALWAGELSARAAAGAAWVNYDANSDIDVRQLDRRELSVKAGLTLPLTSSAAAPSGFLSALGDSEVALDWGRTDLGRYGTLKQASLAFNWQVRSWLRLVATTSRDGQPISLTEQSAPMVISPNVLYFDPVAGETVEVTAIYGGAGPLTNQDLRRRSVAMTATPWRKINLQFDAEYAVEDLRNQIGALPPPSQAIVMAFPDRFQRDASGKLVLVDNRSVNFDRQRSERLRLGLRFTVPLGAATPMAGQSGGRPMRKNRPAKLQVNLSHSIPLSNTLVIRSGLPEIDLLDGGVIGIGGGQQRSISSVSVALTKGSSGIRLEWKRRGPSTLAYGTASEPDRLSFGALATLNANLFADVHQFTPKVKLTQGMRLSLALDNVFNRRQHVTNLAGEMPQAFQPTRRDPVGRTIRLELRKAF